MMVKIIKLSLKLIMSAILLPALFSIKLAAQDSTKTERIIPGSLIKIGFTTAVYDNLKVENTGKRLFKSYPTPGAELNITLYKHIAKGFGINIGAGLSTSLHNFHYRFKYPKNSIFYNDTLDNINSWNYFALLHDIFTFPFSIQKTIHCSNGKLYYSEIGIKRNKLYAFPYSETAHSTVVVDSSDYEEFGYWKHDTGKQFFTSYFLKFGRIRQTKKLNVWQYGLVLHYSPEIIGRGGYAFYNLPFESYGKIEQNINYIGFEIAYGFNIFKKYGKQLKSASLFNKRA